MKKLLSLLFVVITGSVMLSSCGNSAPKEMKANLENGKAIYNKACIACHMTGVAGAAAINNKERWEEIAAKGMKTLQSDAIKGYQGKYGVMPAKGTCADCSDQDIYDAISYMMKQAGVTAKK